jgi:diguanylate cyclase (GGDEF)-like protein/PAS domain S-box-containing protein
MATDELAIDVLSLVDHLDAMVAYWDADQVCVFANQAYKDWFGKSREEIIGQPLKELLGPIYRKNLRHIRAAYQGHKQVFERDFPAPSGGIRSALVTYTPDVRFGQVVGMFVHVADVTPLKQLERALEVAKAKAEDLATHDFLTGLPNRVLLLDRIRQAFTHARRKQSTVALLTVDVDDFKQVNDTYGHDAGDRLLVAIASRLSSVLRESDSVTRMGGDEFLLLATEFESRRQVESLADHLLHQLGRPFEVAGASLSLSLSLGIAVYPADGTTAETLIASSDRALYIAKARGKNRYMFAGSG